MCMFINETEPCVSSLVIALLMLSFNHHLTKTAVLTGHSIVQATERAQLTGIICSNLSSVSSLTMLGPHH